MTRSVDRDLRRVRLRISAVATLAVVAILVVAGYLLVNSFERDLMRQVDARLVATSDRVAQFGASLASVLPAQSGSSTEGLPTMESPQDLVQLIDGTGAVTYSSAALEGEPALWMPGGGERQPRTVQTASNGSLRVSASQFQEQWVVIADPLAPVHEDVDSLRNTMLLGLPALALALALLVWTVVGRALRPVAAAVEREERLVGDVSHELRSPLAGLRVLLETESNDLQEVELNRIEALAVMDRLEAIAEQLLVLRRQEQPRDHRTTRPVDLDEVVLHEAQAVAGRSSAELDISGVAPGQVLGREDDLASLVENLLANAIRHARAMVVVTVRDDDNFVELTVDDDGPGIAVDDRARVFERFTRLDDARSRDRGGAGLGLAIARAIVDAHGGTISVADSHLGGARFIVRLPGSTPRATVAQPIRGNHVY